MSSRAWILVLLVGTTGCRNLQIEAPEGPPPREGVVLRVVDPGGRGVPCSLDFTTSGGQDLERISGNASSDGQGVVQLSVPWARYDLFIRPDSPASLPVFRRTQVELGAEVVVVEYDLEGQPGRVLLPATVPGLATGDHQVSFPYSTDDAGGEYSVGSGLSPSGRFEAFLPERVERARLGANFRGGFSLTRWWEGPILRDPTTELVLDARIHPWTARITVGGNRPLPLGTWIRVVQGSNSISLRTADPVPEHGLWGFERVCSVSVESYGDFLSRTFFLEFPIETTPEWNLGAYVLEVDVVDGSAQPRQDVSIQIAGPSGTIYTGTDIDGRATVFVHAGTYSLTVSPVTRLLEIDGDLRVEVVVP